MNKWILNVEDITELAQEAGGAVASRGTIPFPVTLNETEYQAPGDTARTSGYD